MTQKVKQYIFYDTYSFKRTIKKVKTVTDKPIVHELHFKLVAHRSRFIKDVECFFKTFIEFCEKHPEWKVCLLAWLLAWVNNVTVITT